jgi:thiol:disulfide interchange protein DsbA
MKKIRLPHVQLLFIISTLILLNACSSTSLAPINIIDYKQNIHYKLIDPAIINTNSSNKVEVVEMFFYACPHCNELDKKILPWLVNNKNIVSFKRVPAILGPSWAEQAKAYYVADTLGIIDKIHPALLKAIHQDKRKFHNQYSVMQFFLEQGVNQQDFIKAYHSDKVAEKINQARILTVKSGIRGVPAILINGKYKTAPFYLNCQQNLLDIVDYLINKEISSFNK